MRMRLLEKEKNILTNLVFRTVDAYLYIAFTHCKNIRRFYGKISGN